MTDETAAPTPQPEDPAIPEEAVERAMRAVANIRDAHPYDVALAALAAAMPLCIAAEREPEWFARVREGLVLTAHHAGYSETDLAGLPEHERSLVEQRNRANDMLIDCHAAKAKLDDRVLELQDALRERTGQRDRLRLAWQSAARGRMRARIERDTLGECMPCTLCDDTGIAPEDRFGRDSDGAPMVDGDQPCPKGCPVRRDIAYLMSEEKEAERLRVDLTLATAEAEDARDGGLDLVQELAEVRESRDQYHKNWDAAVAANMTALDTIGGLRASLETRTRERDEARAHGRLVQDEADRLSEEYARADGETTLALRLRAEAQEERDKLGRRLIDADTELTETVDKGRWLLAESAWRLVESEESRFRWAEEAAEMADQRDEARRQRNVMLFDETSATTELALLRNRAVVFPEDWKRQLSTCESSAAGVDLVASWRAADFEAADSPSPVSKSPQTAAPVAEVDKSTPGPLSEENRQALVAAVESGTYLACDGEWYASLPDCERCEATGRINECPDCDGTGKIDRSAVQVEAETPAPRWQPNDHIEWNPTGDVWQRATVMAVPPAVTLLIKLDDQEDGWAPLMVEMRHCRRVSDSTEERPVASPGTGTEAGE